MVTRFLHNRDAITDVVQHLFQHANEIYCIVAFWGRGAERLFGSMDHKISSGKVKIVCNLTMGGTNPKVIADLREKHIEIRHNPNLHAKVLWTDKGVIVGSANASANGLSLEGSDQDGWLEAVIFTDSGSKIKKIKKYVQKIFDEKSSKISKQDMKDAWARWKRRRPIPSPNKDLNFVEALKQGNFTDRQNRIYVVVDTEGHEDTVLQDIQEKAENLQEQDPSWNEMDLDAWSNWNGIPREEYIVNYFKGPRGGVYFEGIWKTLPKRCDRRGGTGLKYHFAHRASEREIGLTVRQRSQLTKIVKCVIRNQHDWLEQHGRCICLQQLLDPQVEDCLQ